MRFRLLLSSLLVAAQVGLALLTLFTPHNAYAEMAGLLGHDPNMLLATTPGLIGQPREYMTGELITKFRFDGLWPSVVPDMNEVVGNDAIHFTEIGADPTVLINNTTYPIASAVRDDADVVVALRKFDTTNTIITDDELYAATYDKIGSVVQQHVDVLQERTREVGLHSLCVSADGANTPVVPTTGSESGFLAGFKALKAIDLLTLSNELDVLKVPRRNRILVLNSYHLNDLLAEQVTSETNVFRDMYVNTKTGDPIDFFGFRIYVDVYPVQFVAAGTKKAFGAAAVSGDRPASVFFIADRTFKARGSVQFYLLEAARNPTMRQSVAGYRLWHTMLPKVNKGFGAIISAPTA